MGYSPAELRVTLSGGETVERTIRLSRVVALDSVVVRAEPRAAIPSFEENRKRGLGHFFTRAQLANLEGSRMSAVLSQMPGLNITTIGTAAWVVSNRGTKTLQNRRCPERENEPGAIQATRETGRQIACTCYPVVYVNDAMIYRGAGANDLVPNVNRFDVASIEAIEFYASPAQTPLKYSTLNSSCGVLVFHTRRTP